MARSSFWGSGGYRSPQKGVRGVEKFEARFFCLIHSKTYPKQQKNRFIHQNRDDVHMEAHYFREISRKQAAESRRHTDLRFECSWLYALAQIRIELRRVVKSPSMAWIVNIGTICLIPGPGDPSKPWWIQPAYILAITINTLVGKNLKLWIP